MKRMLALVLLASLAAGCSHTRECHCHAYQKKYRRPLTGTAWQLVQLYGQNVPPEKGAFTVTLSPEEGRISGSGACNRLSGDYAADETRALKIGPLRTTRMACPGQEQEQKFVEALTTTTHYDMDGPMLMLLCNGELRAVLQAVPEPNEK
ncbi:META domain-containing protein [uncultured Alistipes sp.]|uniref:META domain-containing protein n=1 Tax=uncultured Alistipes sp. TaxID=538949 RepID=UPI0025A99638|nr:META domain-containing protein [uncultured Alistipes sp.]